jgi:PAN domain
LIAALVCVAWSPSWGADIRLVEVVPGKKPIILISGEIGLGDDRKFKSKVSDLDEGIVWLASGGGSVLAGIGIGKAIHFKEFDTVVVEGLECASSCALAWLGGARRWMAPNSAIGFHATYRIKNGVPVESGSGNALVGAYLNKLGLPDRAIIYITETPPEDLEWLTVEKARRYGIEVEVLEDPVEAEGPSRPNEAPQRRATAGDYSLIHNVDVLGEDLGAIRGADFDQCHAACAENRRCGAFTFDRWNRLCFLKAKPRALRLEPRATSGVYRKYSSIQLIEGPPKMSRYRGRVFNDKAFRSFSSKSFEPCERACSDNRECVAFTFEKRKRQCRLFDFANEYFADNRFDSGAKSQSR